MGITPDNAAKLALTRKVYGAHWGLHWKFPGHKQNWTLHQYNIERLPVNDRNVPEKIDTASSEKLFALRTACHKVESSFELELGWKQNKTAGCHLLKLRLPKLRKMEL